MAFEEDNQKKRQAARNQKTNASYNDLTQVAESKNTIATGKQIEDLANDVQNNLSTRSKNRARDNAVYNADSISNQYEQQKKTYDTADTQNKNLANLQQRNARRKSETERFQAQRNLQNAALGLFGSMNQAMNGSTTGNVMSMLANRNDNENVNYWQQLTDNLNSIWDAYDEAKNQNNISRMDAATNAIKGIRDIRSEYSGALGDIENDYDSALANARSTRIANEANAYRNAVLGRRQIQGDLSSYLNNIDPNYYQNPQDIWSPTSAANNFGNKAGQNKANKKASDWLLEQLKTMQSENKIDIYGKSTEAAFNELWKELGGAQSIEKDPEGFWRNMQIIASSKQPGISPTTQLLANQIIQKYKTTFDDKLKEVSLNNPDEYGTSKAYDLFTKGYRAINPNIFNANIASGNQYYEGPRSLDIEDNDDRKTMRNDFSNLFNNPNNAAANTNRVNYLMPAVAEEAIESKRNKLMGNDYFSNLVNGYNNRR